ncbi:hypothetical protein Tco_1450283, partial [Tanacetum coccineum]
MSADVNEVVKDVKVANSVEDDSIDDLNENLNNLDHHFKDMENLENDFSVQPDTLMKEENVTQHETQKEEEVFTNQISLMIPLMLADMYGCCKNHKKAVKTRQTRTRERKECTRAGSLIAK